jgi:hypothetical protein
MHIVVAPDAMYIDVNRSVHTAGTELDDKLSNVIRQRQWITCPDCAHHPH